jgi:hypothetical protein
VIQAFCWSEGEYDWDALKGNAMPKYLVEASYTAEGLKGLIKDKASGRKAVVAQALADPLTCGIISTYCRD